MQTSQGAELLDDRGGTNDGQAQEHRTFGPSEVAYLATGQKDFPDAAVPVTAIDVPGLSDAFIVRLGMLGVAVWTAPPGGSEFIRPPGWPKLTPDGNFERLADFRPGMALCANTGGAVAVLDVDPRNGGDAEAVRDLLARFNVRIFAEVATPSGGRHFYVAGHPELPIVHSTVANEKLPGYPGVDIQSFGCNVFLPGTQRPKYEGRGYRIVFDHLDSLLTHGDAAGSDALAQWVAQCLGNRAKKKSAKRDLADLTFEPVSLWRGGKPDARQQAYLDKFLKDNVKAVALAAPGGRNDVLFLAALKCSSLVAGAGMDEQLVVDRLIEAAEQCGLVDDDGVHGVHATVRSAFRIGSQNPRRVPENWVQPLDDARIGERIADDYLAGRFLYSGGMGWMTFDGRRWKRIGEAIVFEQVRQGVIDFHRREAEACADTSRLQRISGLLSTNRMRAILAVAKGYLAVDDEEFDAHPDLLNVRNGVIDLRDGTLRPHDAGLMLTKVSMTDYKPDAVDNDWRQALSALPPDAADWLQARWGQGLTGYPPPDDVLVVLKGSGENGKTTLVDAIQSAVGLDYAVPLPDRVLLARPGDHPTEIMTLRGTRLAFMEELPEMGHLNVKRLKDIVGTDRITARYIGKDTVSWRTTHSMFVTTNYLPRVDESDHGTWRRLALVVFPYRYRKQHESLDTTNDRHGDPDLRGRLRRGYRQHEAALAWLVRGAIRWYQSGQVMPPPPQSVIDATQEWRKSADLLLRYLDDNLTFDAGAHVMATELFEDFSDWLKDKGHKGWTDQNFSTRLAQHPVVVAAGVERKRGVRASRQGLSRPPQAHRVGVPKQFAAWLGISFTGRRLVQQTRCRGG